MQQILYEKIASHGFLCVGNSCESNGQRFIHEKGDRKDIEIVCECVLEIHSVVVFPRCSLNVMHNNHNTIYSCGYSAEPFVCERARDNERKNKTKIIFPYE